MDGPLPVTRKRVQRLMRRMFSKLRLPATPIVAPFTPNCEATISACGGRSDDGRRMVPAWDQTALRLFN